MTNNKSAVFAVVLCAVVLAATSARAELQVCNGTLQPVFFETSLRHTGDIANATPWGLSVTSCQGALWDSIGWFEISSCSCVNVWNGDARGQEFHWTAQGANDGALWGGTDPAEVWVTPNISHDNCDEAIDDFCSNSVPSCSQRGHMDVGSSWQGMMIAILPNNTFGSGQSCADFNRQGGDDCIAFEIGGACG
jgi:hypothetical protein